MPESGERRRRELAATRLHDLGEVARRKKEVLRDRLGLGDDGGRRRRSLRGLQLRVERGLGLAGRAVRLPCDRLHGVHRRRAGGCEGRRPAKSRRRGSPGFAARSISLGLGRAGLALAQRLAGQRLTCRRRCRRRWRLHASLPARCPPLIACSLGDNGRLAQTASRLLQLEGQRRVRRHGGEGDDEQLHQPAARLLGVELPAPRPAILLDDRIGRPARGGQLLSSPPLPTFAAA